MLSALPRTPLPRSTRRPEPQLPPQALYSYYVEATDPNGDPLSYRLDAAPTGMTVDSFGRISWTPTFDDSGTHDVLVTVRDSFGESDSQSYQILVEPDEQAPSVVLT